MTIIKPILAKSSDLNAIMELFDSCRQHMIDHGVFQWDDRYPVREIVAEDIELETVFVLKEATRIVGTITLNEVQAAAYQEISWLYEAAKVLVIHRLAIHPQMQGKAYGKAMCLFAEDWGKKHQYALIRLDAYSANPAANRLYESLAYHRAEGLCYFHGNSIPFYCYEKQLLKKTE